MDDPNFAEVQGVAHFRPSQPGESSRALGSRLLPPVVALHGAAAAVEVGPGLEHGERAVLRLQAHLEAMAMGQKPNRLPVRPK